MYNIKNSKELASLINYTNLNNMIGEKEMREFDCGYHTGYNDNIYCGIGNEAFFWTSTELTDYRNSSEHALYFFLHGLENGGFRTSDWGEFTKRAALSVRCVK